MNIKKIEDLCTIVRGSSPRPKGDKRFYGGNIPRLMVSDVTRDGMYVTPKTDFLTLEGSKLSRWMSKGDIVVAVSGNPGEAAILTVDACIHDGFVGLRKLNSSVVFAPYLYRYFTYFKEKNKAQAVGAIYKNLNTDQIKALKIPLPPLTEQKRIAAILDAADQHRQKTKELIAKYDALSQSLFLDMFGDPVTNPKGWELSSLEEYINIKHGFAFKSEFFATQGHYTLLTPGNFFEKGGYKNQGAKQKFYEGKIPNEYILKPNDVLLAMTEQAAGLLGSSLFVPNDGTFLHNQRLGLVEYKKDVNLFYIKYLFNQSSIRKLIHAQATGTKVRHTSPKKLLAIKVGIPSLDIQSKFADQIQEIEKQKAQAAESLKKAENLFHSLLQKAFKGELIQLNQ